MWTVENLRMNLSGAIKFLKFFHNLIEQVPLFFVNGRRLILSTKKSSFLLKYFGVAVDLFQLFLHPTRNYLFPDQSHLENEI